jgi:hypothetical protein
MYFDISRKRLKRKTGKENTSLQTDLLNEELQFNMLINKYIIDYCAEK